MQGYDENMAVVQQARAVSRKQGCMSADSFVGIWKFIARPNLCGTPTCVKPPGVARKQTLQNSAYFGSAKYDSFAFQQTVGKWNKNSPFWGIDRYE